MYHGPREVELTYSVVAPLGAAGMPPALGACYRLVHAAIADGLSRLGAAVELAGRRRPMLRPANRRACFAASVPGEIVAAGRKLVGSAQRRSRRSFLQHGSIPLAGDQSALSAIWPGSLDPDRVTTVSAAAGRAIGFDELAFALAAAFEIAIGHALVPGAFTPDEEGRFGARSSEPALA